MGMILTGDWRKSVRDLGAMARRGPGAVEKAVRDEAYFFQKRVILAFRKGGARRKWHPLSPITIALRKGSSWGRGTKPLIRTGGLRKSVNVKREGAGHYFVGVQRSAPRSRGMSGKGAPLVNVAAINETGLVVIPITDKMRKYFRVLFWKGILPFPWPPPGKKYITIRRRSFLKDTMDVFKRGHEKRIFARYDAYVRGHGRRKFKWK